MNLNFVFNVLRIDLINTNYWTLIWFNEYIEFICMTIKWSANRIYEYRCESRIENISRQKFIQVNYVIQSFFFATKKYVISTEKQSYRWEAFLFSSLKQETACSCYELTKKSYFTMFYLSLFFYFSNLKLIHFRFVSKNSIFIPAS